MTQAVLEGVALSLADAQGYLAETGALPDRIAVNGGGSRSRFWMKILASALNKTVLLQEGSEAGPGLRRGAARPAGGDGEDPRGFCSKPAIAGGDRARSRAGRGLCRSLTRFRALYRAVAPLY